MHTFTWYESCCSLGVPQENQPSHSKDMMLDNDLEARIQSHLTFVAHLGLETVEPLTHPDRFTLGSYSKVLIYYFIGDYYNILRINHIITHRETYQPTKLVISFPANSGFRSRMPIDEWSMAGFASGGWSDRSTARAALLQVHAGTPIMEKYIYTEGGASQSARSTGRNPAEATPG